MAADMPQNSDDASLRDGQRKISFSPRQTDIPASVVPVKRLLTPARLLMISCVVTIGVVITWLQQTEMAPELNISLDMAKATLKKDNLSMTGMIYNGVTRSGKPFTIVADEALEDVKDSSFVELVRPRARMDMGSPRSLTVQSLEGLYNRQENRIDLNGSVIITRPSDGYVLTTEAAVADMQQGILESTLPVFGSGPRATVNAEGMVVRENGAVVIFNGRSRLVLK